MSQPDYYRHETRSGQNAKSWAQSVRELHQLYCHWTDQTLSQRFDRERLWYEFLRAGFSARALKRVITYLQKEIGAQRRNVGALKLSKAARKRGVRFGRPRNSVQIRSSWRYDLF